MAIVNKIDINPSGEPGNFLNYVYPVGSIYISVNSANPSTLFGGAWEQIQGQFLLSAGNGYTAGTTGGEATHTLTKAEMPIDYGSHSGGSRGISSWVDNATVLNDGSYKTGNIGGGQPHNNMPPYLVVYMWKRTA